MYFSIQVPALRPVRSVASQLPHSAMSDWPERLASQVPAAPTRSVGSQLRPVGSVAMSERVCLWCTRDTPPQQPADAMFCMYCGGDVAVVEKVVWRWWKKRKIVEEKVGGAGGGGGSGDDRGDGGGGGDGGGSHMGAATNS
jgi:hypothetical protein